MRRKSRRYYYPFRHYYLPITAVINRRRWKRKSQTPRPPRSTAARAEPRGRRAVRSEKTFFRWHRTFARARRGSRRGRIVFRVRAGHSARNDARIGRQNETHTIVIVVTTGHPPYGFDRLCIANNRGVERENGLTSKRQFRENDKKKNAIFL